MQRKTEISPCGQRKARRSQISLQEFVIRFRLSHILFKVRNIASFFPTLFRHPCFVVCFPVAQAVLCSHEWTEEQTMNRNNGRTIAVRLFGEILPFYHDDSSGDSPVCGRAGSRLWAFPAPHSLPLPSNPPVLRIMNRATPHGGWPCSWCSSGDSNPGHPA